MNEKVLARDIQYQKGWIGTPYVFEYISPTLEIDGDVLIAKPSFHMSIFSVKKYTAHIAQKTGRPESEVEQWIIQEAERLLHTNVVTVGKIREEFRLVEEQDKKTVVVMCTASGLEEFFDGMRRALQIEIPLQPTHITLYTREGGIGIGLTEDEDVQKLTRLLTPEETSLVKKAVRL